MVPAVLIRKSTKEIIKQGNYPREDMAPFLVGEIDPDYEWLIKHTPYAEPPYDSRIYIMDENTPEGQELLECPEHPSYPGIKAYTLIFTPIRRTNEDIIRSIENAEKEANNLVFSEAVHKDEFAFMLNSVHKDAKSLELTASEQDQIDKLAIVTVALAKNKDTKENKIAQVLAGQVPNIDEGWEKSL
ncbi:MAG: hypothetical protein H7Y10_03565 [Flavobacterium sp.]|nr:hypothetical protein [Flavobacterium sp.]